MLLLLLHLTMIHFKKTWETSYPDQKEKLKELLTINISKCHDSHKYKRKKLINFAMQLLFNLLRPLMVLPFL